MRTRRLAHSNADAWSSASRSPFRFFMTIRCSSGPMAREIAGRSRNIGSCAAIIDVILTLRVKLHKARRPWHIEISWEDNKLEKACSSEKNGQRRFGEARWRLLKRRLASLKNADTLAEMEGVPGNCHALGGDRAGQYAVSLDGPYRLIFKPDDEPLPRLEDGGIDRHSVTSIRIEEVVNYHGN